MSAPRALIVIPARYGSTRFRAKALAPLGGKPVVQWCWEAAKKAGVGPVLIATDDKRIADVAHAFGAETVMTPRSCPSGSDRVALAAKKVKAGVVINLQGDEPFISPAALRALVKALADDRGADVATLAAPIRDAHALRDPNTVKVALARGGRALYFSRRLNEPLQHIGVYAYRRRALYRFVALKPSPLEKSERLEQLRGLEDGMTYTVVKVPRGTVAIDTPADLRRAERVLKNGRKG